MTSLDVTSPPLLSSPLPGASPAFPALPCCRRGCRGEEQLSSHWYPLNHVQVCMEQEQRFLFLPEAAAIEGPQAPHNLSFLGLMVCVCLYVDRELRSYHEKFCSGLPAGTSLGFAIRVTGQKPAWFTSHCSRETCSGMSLAEGGCCNQSTPLLPLSSPLPFATVLPMHGGHLQPRPSCDT